MMVLRSPILSSIQQAPACAGQSLPSQPASPPTIPRRALLSGVLTLTPALIMLQTAPPATADTILQDTTRRFLRPEVQPPDAVLKLLNAKAALVEMKQLAATALDSEERVRARSRLPTYAKYLREVGPATPVVAGLVTGDSEGSLTQAYGGTGQGGQSISVPIYEAVGRILSLSGRGIQPEALEGVERVEAAIARIDDLLQKVPAEVMQVAQAQRTPSQAN